MDTSEERLTSAEHPSGELQEAVEEPCQKVTVSQFDTVDAILDRESRIPSLTTVGKKPMFDAGELRLESYNLNFPNFAQPIILNHKNFSKTYVGCARPNKREGTDQDVKSLKDTFRTLSCLEPIVHDDRTADEIASIIKEASQDDYSNVACLIIVILTHGEENELYAYDKKYDIGTVLHPFTKQHLHNRSLIGKPKLFFIQACRGEVLDVALDTVDAKPLYTSKRKIPQCADFFIAYSSFYGYMSVRNTMTGSWYIQTLCEAIEKFHGQTDLNSIMTIVKYGVGYNKTFKESEKQIPCTETTLTKLLYLSKTALDKVDRSTRIPKLSDKGVEATDSRADTPGPSFNLQSLKQYLSPSYLRTTNLNPISIWAVLATLLAIFVAWLLKANVECNCECHPSS